MPLSTSEAAETLRTHTHWRCAGRFDLYRASASPHLILWGAVWALGYGATAINIRPEILWPALSLAGTAGSFWIGWRMRPANTSRYDWRYIATFLAVVLFVIALFNILPATSMQIGAFFPLLASLFYALIGIWTKGRRMILLGAALAALTLSGYFALPAYFAPWMAVVGGGGLVLGGIWLRRV